MRIVGVHIEKYGIYACCVNAKNQLEDSCFLPLSLDLSSEQKEMEFSLKIGELLKKFPKNSHSYVFSIPTKQISVHELSFPFKEKFKIHRALPFEMEEVIPFSHAVYNFKISYLKGKQSWILNFVSSKKWVDHF